MSCLRIASDSQYQTRAEREPQTGGMVGGADQVRKELRKVKARKATGPDGTRSRLLKDCADQLCKAVLHIFNMSLSLEKVPALWKISCVVPVPKTVHPRGPNHFRLVALTSHLMKNMERIILIHL
eukprot:superscaffoldBa00000148_g2148